MQGLPKFEDANLIIGTDGFSDAGVYRLRDDLLILQSLDFFPPLVDDPFLFGQIAAANSLSDIYAMGGRPVTALNIVGFPDDQLDLQILNEILRGGADRVLQAGAVIVGGHTVRDTEIKYGLSVTGVCEPGELITNQGAQPGDVLVLTKPLGTGFITTAFKAQRCPDDVIAAAAASMAMLNASASQAAKSVRACGNRYHRLRSGWAHQRNGSRKSSDHGSGTAPLTDLGGGTSTGRAGKQDPRQRQQSQFRGVVSPHRARCGPLAAGIRF